MAEYDQLQTGMSYSDAVRVETEALGARLVLVAWPYRSQVDQEIRDAVRYQIVMSEFARAAGVPFVPLAVPFLDDDRSLFLDNVHANADGNAVAARAIRPWVAP